MFGLIHFNVCQRWHYLSDFLNLNDILIDTLWARKIFTFSKTAVLLANGHHSDQNKFYKRFCYFTSDFVIVHAMTTVWTECQRKWNQGGTASLFCTSWSNFKDFCNYLSSIYEYSLIGSSSRCHGVVCGLWLWYFLIILTYYFWSDSFQWRPEMALFKWFS